MTRFRTRVLATLAISGALVGLASSAAAAAPRPVTVWFGIAADPSVLHGTPALPTAPPQLGVSSPPTDTSGLCRVALSVQRARAGAVAVLDAARRQGCIRSYRVSAKPSAQPGAGRVVQAINDVAGRWDLYENGVRPDYYAVQGIEGYVANTGDRIVFSLVPLDAALPRT